MSTSLTTTTTTGQEYANYLIRNQESFRSTLLQLPYRLHIKRLKLGKTLDIGCGAGRNLRALNLNSIGIDHNSLLVAACVRFGFHALSTDAFLMQKLSYQNAFDSILISHVAEHMRAAQFTGLLKEYFQFLKPGGRVVVLCPQEKGYATDPTHVQFMDFSRIAECLSQSGFKVLHQYSFPFPRSFGRVFPHNEFTVIAEKHVRP